MRQLIQVQAVAAVLSLVMLGEAVVLLAVIAKN
jgi:hypothetical protein